MFRVLVVIGALPLLAFFVWPWASRAVIDPAIHQQISISAGGLSATIPMVFGVFGTLGLVGMLLAIKR